jgi:hypothetical protein
MRRIVQLAGAKAEFALADDGTVWLWTGYSWMDVSRPPLPQPEGAPLRSPEMDAKLKLELDAKISALTAPFKKGSRR